MVSETPNPQYRVREVPFDDWADIDALVHRTSLTNGDFDYLLQPLCSDCGQRLDFEYETVRDAEQLAALVCRACLIEWRLAPGT